MPDDRNTAEWFREPSPRERAIAAALFIAFAAFFVALFLVQRGWWFRWVILGLAVASFVYGARHALRSRSDGGR